MPNALTQFVTFLRNGIFHQKASAEKWKQTYVFSGKVILSKNRFESLKSILPCFLLSTLTVLETVCAKTVGKTNGGMAFISLKLCLKMPQSKTYGFISDIQIRGIYKKLPNKQILRKMLKTWIWQRTGLITHRFQFYVL